MTSSVETIRCSGPRSLPRPLKEFLSTILGTEIRLLSTLKYDGSSTKVFPSNLKNKSGAEPSELMFNTNISLTLNIYKLFTPSRLRKIIINIIAE